MGKQVISVVVGVIAGMAAMMVVNYVSIIMYPVPDGLDMSNSEAMSNYIDQLPILAKLIVLISWMAGAFVGGLVAALIAPEGKGRALAILVGALLMGGGIVNALSIPHPMWMLIIGLLLYIPLAHLGAKAAGK